MSTSTSPAKQPELKNIPLNRIQLNPVALRSVNKTTEKYAGLVESIRNVGVQSSISVREIANPDPNDPEPLYGIINGLHRFTACQDLGLPTIPCGIMSMNDAEMMEAQIISNIHTIETTPTEYSRQLQRMIAANPALIGPEVAARLGKSVTWLNERLNLTNLNEPIQKLVDEGKIKLTSAFALSKLDSSLQNDFVERAMTQGTADFVMACQKAKKEFDAAKRAGRDPNADTFQVNVKPQKISVLKDEMEEPKIGPALIAKLGISSPAEAWALAIKWVMNSDPESIEAQRQKHEQRLQAAKKAKEDAKAEREKKSAEKAAQTQAEVQLAPGITLKPEEQPVRV